MITPVEEATRLDDALDHPSLGEVIEVAHVPAAVLEAAGGVLVGLAGRLG
jgi:hypothetical protein